MSFKRYSNLEAAKEVAMKLSSNCVVYVVHVPDLVRTEAGMFQGYYVSETVVKTAVLCFEPVNGKVVAAYFNQVRKHVEPRNGVYRLS